MRWMKSSLITSAFSLTLLIGGCSATPAAGPAGPQGPPGPQGQSAHDRDRDRDPEQRRQEQARRDQAASCPE
jgi:hypothetical protein